MEELFETCRWAPSSENTQPWEIAVLGGKVMEELKARLGERARLDPMGKTFHPDIPLNELYGPYLERRLAVRDSILVDGGLLLSH